MPVHTPSRRDFLSTSTSALGGAWLVGMGPLVDAARAYARTAVAEQVAFRTFTAREGADFDAFAARIVPTDDTPGAREAGAVYFADRALGTFLADILPIVRSGLASLSERARVADPTRAGFSSLDERAQDRIIRDVEADASSPFFFMARVLVMLGTFSDPMHGGNRDRVGWRLVGFEPQAAHEPPFGFYDAGSGTRGG